jgi:hypothetical protein
MEQILEIAASVRTHYLEKMIASFEDFRTLHSPSALEVLFELQRECAYPFRLYRADMASNTEDGPKLQDVNPEGYLNFNAITESISETLQVTLNPIAWHGVDFDCDKVLTVSDLEGWAMRWLDVEDEHIQDSVGLQGVIHSVTAPELQGSRTEFSVDFGSAPVEALKELLDSLSSIGATSVKIRSSCLG